jgi:hypothetical protein
MPQEAPPAGRTYIDELVAAAPALSDAQRARLTVLLAGVR